MVVNNSGPQAKGGTLFLCDTNFLISIWHDIIGIKVSY